MPTLTYHMREITLKSKEFNSLTPYWQNSWWVKSRISDPCTQGWNHASLWNYQLFESPQAWFVLNLYARLAPHANFGPKKMVAHFLSFFAILFLGLPNVNLTQTKIYWKVLVTNFLFVAFDFEFSKLWA